MANDILLNEYVRLKFLGQGSFAKIYKVKHRDLGYIRAIKVLTEELDEEEGSKVYETFLKECSLLLRLGNGTHPNIVRIYQPRKIAGQALVEMDYIDGLTLNKYIAECKYFVSYNEVLKFVRQIGSALAYCHVDCYSDMRDNSEDEYLSDEELISKYGVAHNDLHSNNIMRKKRDGSYILLDFGLAIQDRKCVKSSSRNDGAVEYMPPEKWSGLEVKNEKASDIYSFGVLMYEMLTGVVPFPLYPTEEERSDQLKCLNNLRKKHEVAKPSPIGPLREQAFINKYPDEKYLKDYPYWLEHVIFKCLEKDPADRYQNARQMLDDIENAIKESEQTGQISEELEEQKKARDEAERVKKEAERAKEEAERAKEEAKRAIEEAERVKEEVERVKEEAERTSRDVSESKTDEDTDITSNYIPVDDEDTDTKPQKDSSVVGEPSRKFKEGEINLVNDGSKEGNPKKKSKRKWLWLSLLLLFFTISGVIAYVENENQKQWVKETEAEAYEEYIKLAEECENEINAYDSKFDDYDYLMKIKGKVNEMKEYENRYHYSVDSSFNSSWQLEDKLNPLLMHKASEWAKRARKKTNDAIALRWYEYSLNLWDDDNVRQEYETRKKGN